MTKPLRTALGYPYVARGPYEPVQHRPRNLRCPCGRRLPAGWRHRECPACVCDRETAAQTAQDALRATNGAPDDTQPPDGGEPV